MASILLRNARNHSDLGPWIHVEVIVLVIICNEGRLLEKGDGFVPGKPWGPVQHVQSNSVVPKRLVCRHLGAERNASLPPKGYLGKAFETVHGTLC